MGIQIIKEHSASFEFLNPCRHNQAAGPAIVEQDKRDIDHSDAVLCNIFRYSAGTLMELLYSFMQDKLAVVLTTPEIRDDVWINFHASYMAPNLDAAMDFLEKKLLKK